MTYHLGKKFARKGAVTFQFNDFFDSKKLPTPPATFGHYQAIQDFQMLANDQFGCCVLAGADHEEMIWSVEGGRPQAKFTNANTLSDYAALTGFDPTQTDAQGNNPTDQGTDMSAAASYRKKTGVLCADGSRKTIDAYVALEVGNWNQLILATWLMGASGIGLNLPQSAITQFDARQPWSISVWNRRPRMVGGHYVCGAGRDIKGNMPVVSWGRTNPMTKGFYERFSDEALAYLSLDILNERNLSPEGYDAVTLRKHLGSLS